MPRCKVCKGKGTITGTAQEYTYEPNGTTPMPLTITVEGGDSFTRDLYVTSSKKFTIPCMDCKGTGYMNKAEREKWQKFHDSWCRCKEPAVVPGWELTLAPEQQHMRSWVFCGQCGKVVST